MMIQLTVIFGFLAAASALVIYGTIVKNKWGINTGDIHCPHCGAPLSKGDWQQSRRQRMWGGCVCSGCGSEVDKWGRELRVNGESGPKIPEEHSLKSEQTRQPSETPFFDRFKGRSPRFWLIFVLFVILNISYDFYFPEAILFDVFAVGALFVWYYKSPKK
jgi:hypothetical protein